MKNVLFVINNLKIGGVQSSLINLIKAIQNDYNITVLSFENDKKDLNKLPTDIHIIKARPIMRYLGISQRELKKYPFAYIF